MTVIVGARGRLAQAFAELHSAGALTAPAREVYETWWRPDGVERAYAYLARTAGPDTPVLIFSGLLEAGHPAGAYEKINYALPRNVVDAALARSCRPITFGTILERLAPTASPYVKTKSKLSAHVARAAERGQPATHIRLHTLYGRGEPTPQMFLGQIVSALRNGETFRMTSGRQLREYHHVDDDAAAIARVIGNRSPGIFELHHGEPVRLRDIAVALFRACELEHLLALDALPDPPLENYQHRFERPALVQDLAFHDTIPALKAYVKDILDHGVPPGNE